MMKNKIKIFSVFLLLGITLIHFLLPQISYASINLGEQIESRDGLSQESLTRHQWFATMAEGLLTLTGTNIDGSESSESDETGALQFTSGLIAALYSRPAASGVYYAYDTIQKIGPKAAYAQGIGFSGLRPIMDVWKAFRNVTYVLFTLIFIGVGLAIMLQVKISPQAVISIENAIPKIIGALILVTFSYAIAGFMIDLMYVFIALAINILKIGGINPALFQIPKTPIIAGQITTEKVINNGFFSLLPMFFSLTTSGIGFLLLGGTIGGIIGGLGGLPVGPAGGFMGIALGATGGVVIIMLIWSVIALVLLFKLLFGLIKAYINIILAIILAPFQIMVGAIPGVEAGGFGSWFKGLVTELAIFPAVVVVAMIGVFLMQSFETSTMWSPPFLSAPEFGSLSSWFATTFGLVSGTADIPTVLMKTIIGMGFLLILAKIPDIIRQAMKTEKGYGSAIGQALGPIPGLVNQGGRMGAQVGTGAGLTLLEGELDDRGMPKKMKFVEKIHEAGKNLKITT
jgi:hypothetical protein